MRTRETLAEAALWSQLKGRQFGVGSYVVDFYCPQARLAVELDGAVHDGPGQRTYDAERTEALAAVDTRVVRFENRAVFERGDAVLATVLGACRQRAGDGGTSAVSRPASSSA